MEKLQSDQPTRSHTLGTPKNLEIYSRCDGRQYPTGSSTLVALHGLDCKAFPIIIAENVMEAYLTTSDKSPASIGPAFIDAVHTLDKYINEASDDEDCWLATNN